jgi:4-alpha-glucanotransferase
VGKFTDLEIEANLGSPLLRPACLCGPTSTVPDESRLPSEAEVCQHKVIAPAGRPRLPFVHRTPFTEDSAGIDLHPAEPDPREASRTICMSGRRRSGILLHISSLPGDEGIGDFGPAAYRFVDFLQRSGQSLWQVLPIGPTGYGGTPYQSPSAFAGNSLFISLQLLVDNGLLRSFELRDGATFSRGSVDLELMPPWRGRRLADAYRNFLAAGDAVTRARFHRFREAEAAWLNDYALFVALKDTYSGASWTSWDLPLVRREAAALADARRDLAAEIDAEMFNQFLFAEQWRALKRYANDHGVELVGDAPIFVAHDSADVWVNQHLFYLDEVGRPTVVAGVPPDYFSETGQLWGNPLYRWDVMHETGYAWWIERLRYAFRQFDVLRIDHFRGFEAYWEVPADAVDARPGRWVKGPGIELFRAAEQALGPLPIWAEDLGLITPEVEALRRDVGAPGMRVLQFSFGDDAHAAEDRPHSYPRHSIAYTGTHDNDTSVGWFYTQPGVGNTRSADDVNAERHRILSYLGTDAREVHWDLIRLAFSTASETAIIPLQDVLGLGSEARMNTPGRADGNWRWRYLPEQITPEMEHRLRLLTETYERAAPTDVRVVHS